jgi:hypothetical protein
MENACEISSDEGALADEESTVDRPGAARSFENSLMTNFFTLSDQDGKNYTVECKLCAPKKKRLRTATNSFSNLKRHLDVSTFLVTWQPLSSVTCAINFISFFSEKASICVDETECSESGRETEGF